MDTPTLSILVPNFDNGRRSSRDGTRDMLGDLFRSLEATLVDDPTPLEILVADDGSTDDSLETCRAWAGRTWPGGPRAGTPFCRFMPFEHCGVLSVVANRLTRAARGEICCRLDGDIIVHTRGWAALLVETFRNGPPDLGVIGPKQLGMDGRVHAAGSWILHPRGHHHVGQGVDPAIVHRTAEVDHVMGCFYCHRRALWEELGGYDEDILRGQTVDFGLRARLHGHRTWCVPTIEFTHCHAERARRGNEADTDAGIEAARAAFRRKWGFDRIAPDLDEVAGRYAGTPLLWNAKVFGPARPFPPSPSGPVALEASEWARYASEPAFRAAIDLRVALAREALERAGGRGRVALLRCRGGLLCHLVAAFAGAVTGIDPEPALIELGRAVLARQAGDGPPSRVRRQRERGRLPLRDGSADVVVLCDVLEHEFNPMALLREAHRVLTPGGVVAILTRRRAAVLDDAATAGYLPSELVGQLQATGLFTARAPAVDGGTASLAVLGERRDGGSSTNAVSAERPAVARSARVTAGR